jgi:cell division protease FtsH
MRYGRSEELGPRTLGHDQSLPFLGREFAQQADYSDEVARQIDDEIRRIIEDAHQRAVDLLAGKRELLDGISKVLISRKTLERREFEALLVGTAEEEVLREKDEERDRSGGSEPKPQRAKSGSRAGVPAAVSPMTPETS